jgi:ATP-dependent Zn protease
LFASEPIIDGLEVFGVEAVDDFLSGFLPLLAEADERAHHQRIRQEIRATHGDDAFGGSTPANTAIHEAGHAVIGMLYGLSVERLCIEPPAWGGCCDFGPDISDIELIADARISLAGLVAEEELTGVAKIGECISDIADAAAAIHLVAMQSGVSYGDLLLQTYAETTDLVRAHRAMIERIADALQNKLSLDTSDIARLMEA